MGTELMELSKHQTRKSPTANHIFLFVPKDNILVGQISSKDIQGTPNCNINSTIACFLYPLQVVHC
uniref:Pco071948b n=1 Tax=Arundo donax TaxID=35708 RepID=A0A0A9CSB4_ARUDO